MSAGRSCGFNAPSSTPGELTPNTSTATPGAGQASGCSRSRAATLPAVRSSSAPRSTTPTASRYSCCASIRVVFSRLRITSHGPGFVHLPEWVDEEYLAQRTAEKAIRKYVKGRGAVRERIKLRERNEALDLEVYALAALQILGHAFIRGLGTQAAKFAVPTFELPEPVRPQPQKYAVPFVQVPRRPGGWINSWRG